MQSVTAHLQYYLLTSNPEIPPKMVTELLQDVNLTAKRHT